MQVNFHNQTMARLKQVSQVIGIREENLIQRAVLYYLDAIQKQAELIDEMNAWDNMSDELSLNLKRGKDDFSEFFGVWSEQDLCEFEMLLNGSGKRLKYETKHSGRYSLSENRGTLAGCPPVCCANYQSYDGSHLF